MSRPAGFSSSSGSTIRSCSTRPARADIRLRGQRAYPRKSGIFRARPRREGGRLCCLAAGSSPALPIRSDDTKLVWFRRAWPLCADAPGCPRPNRVERAHVRCRRFEPRDRADRHHRRGTGGGAPQPAAAAQPAGAGRSRGAGRGLRAGRRGPVDPRPGADRRGAELQLGLSTSARWSSASRGSGDGGHDSDAFERTVDRLEALRVPTIAALNGSVYGGATDLALACDFRIGVKGMRLLMPAARLGIVYYPSGIRALCLPGSASPRRRSCS